MFQSNNKLPKPELHGYGDETYDYDERGLLVRRDGAELSDEEWEEWRSGKIRIEFEAQSAMDALRFKTMGYDRRIGGGICWNRGTRVDG